MLRKAIISYDKDEKIGGILKKAFGSWKKVKVPSVEYVRELRKNWSKRHKRFESWCKQDLLLLEDVG